MASTRPQWQETVVKKRQLRDEAIQSFVDGHSTSKNTASASIDQVEGILNAVSSGTVTASELCIVYIHR
jgi:amidase